MMARMSLLAVPGVLLHRVTVMLPVALSFTQDFIGFAPKAVHFLGPFSAAGSNIQRERDTVKTQNDSGRGLRQTEVGRELQGRMWFAGQIRGVHTVLAMMRSVCCLQ